MLLAEAIKVDVGFRNPLQIPISISSISLICEHYASSAEKDSGKPIQCPFMFIVYKFTNQIHPFSCSSSSYIFQLSCMDILTFISNVKLISISSATLVIFVFHDVDATSSIISHHNDEESSKLSVNRCISDSSRLHCLVFLFRLLIPGLFKL